MSFFIFCIGLLAGSWIVGITAAASGFRDTGLIGIVIGLLLCAISVAVGTIFGDNPFDLIILEAKANGMFYILYGIGVGITLTSIVIIIVDAISRRSH